MKSLRGSAIVGLCCGFFIGIFVLMQVGNSYGLWPLALCAALGSMGGSFVYMGEEAEPKTRAGRKVRGALLWLRTPLQHGGAWATWTTVLWVFAIATLLVCFPMDGSHKAFVLLLGSGVFGILLGLARPRYFWHNRLVEGWRWFFGDRGTAAIYVGLGAGLIVGFLGLALG